ncbi:MAG: Co2+/Mg2+ efflux protein ApaG [Bacteroidota bacterium]
MIKLTTKDITVSAESFYQAEYSEPESEKYIFAYRIRISNNSLETVQLLNRRWRVVEGDGREHIVEGEGVIGQQPVIEPGKSHVYMSWVQMNAPIGAMEGYYEFRKNWEFGPEQEERFRVGVPKLVHWMPELAN